MQFWSDIDLTMTSASDLLLPLLFLLSFVFLLLLQLLLLLLLLLFEFVLLLDFRDSCLESRQEDDCLRFGWIVLGPCSICEIKTKSFVQRLLQENSD